MKSSQFSILLKRKAKYLCSIGFRWIFGINERKVLFVSFGGKTYSDNPRAISEALHEVRPDADIVWGLNERKREPSTVPPYVRTYSTLNKLNHVKEVATSKVYVTNFEMDYIKKSKRQFFIQTMHGDRGFKKVYYDTDVKNFFTPESIDNYCDLAVCGSTFGGKVYRSAFRYKGEILMEGCPRCDRLVHVDPAEQVQIKEKLQIPMKTRVLLYAPTFRDHRGGHFRKYMTLI